MLTNILMDLGIRMWTSWGNYYLADHSLETFSGNPWGSIQLLHSQALGRARGGTGTGTYQAPSLARGVRNAPSHIIPIRTLRCNCYAQVR